MQNSLITHQYLDIAPEVALALAENRPVVALESTIISTACLTRKTLKPPCR